MINDEKVKQKIKADYDSCISKFERNKNEDNDRSYLDLIREIHGIYEYIFREIVAYTICKASDLETRNYVGEYERNKGKSFHRMEYGLLIGLIKSNNNFLYNKFIEMLEIEDEGLKSSRKRWLVDGLAFGFQEDFIEVRNKGAHNKDNYIEYSLENLGDECKEKIKKLYEGIYDEKIDSELKNFDELLDKLQSKFEWLQESDFITKKIWRERDEIIRNCKENKSNDVIIEILEMLDETIEEIASENVEKEEKSNSEGISGDRDFKENYKVNSDINAKYNDVDEEEISFDKDMTEYKLTGVVCFGEERINVKKFAKAVKLIIEELGKKDEYREKLFEVRNNSEKYSIPRRFFALEEIENVRKSSIKRIESLDFDICTHYSANDLIKYLARLLNGLNVPHGDIKLYGYKKPSKD